MNADDSDYLDFTKAGANNKKSTIVLFQSPSSSSSLLSSRFTDDKYVTPSVVGYEEYKEMMESAKKVEDELENVLGKTNEDVYGVNLPSYTSEYAYHSPLHYTFKNCF